MTVSILLIITDFEFFEKLIIQYPGGDKILHFLWYGILAWIGFKLTSRLYSPPLESRIILLVALFLVAVSILAEILQTGSIYRSFEYGDILANFSGVFFAWILYHRKKLKPAIKYPGIALALLTVSLLTILSYSTTAYYQRGLDYQKSGKYPLAKQQYLQAIDKGIHNPAIYNEIAWIMIEYLQDNPAKATEYAMLALSENPDNPDYLDTYGWSLYHSGKYQEALPYLQESYELNPDIFCIHYHLGATYLKLGRVEESVYHLAQQVKRDARDRDGLKAAALLLEIKKDSSSGNFNL